MSTRQRRTTGRRVERDMFLRTNVGYRITCLTTPVIPAVWAGITGAVSRPTVAVFVVVALVLGTTMCVLWSIAFVQLDRGTLRYRLYGRLREVPIADVGYPEHRAGLAGSRLIVKVGGRTAFALYQRIWNSAELDAFARELIARRSKASLG